jgi:Rrf2 family protein
MYRQRCGGSSPFDGTTKAVSVPSSQLQIELIRSTPASGWGKVSCVLSVRCQLVLCRNVEIRHNLALAEGPRLKISQKGLYALQATMTLARRHQQGAIKIREIAAESHLPEKFLELILLEMKNARIVDSIRGARGGYRLRRNPDQIPLSEIIRLIDGPLAPLGDAEQLRTLIAKDSDHRALYEVFLAVRDAAAKILEHTTIADLIRPESSAGLAKNIQKRGKQAAKSLQASTTSS